MSPRNSLKFLVGFGGLNECMICFKHYLAGVRIFLSHGFQNYLPTLTPVTLAKMGLSVFWGGIGGPVTLSDQPRALAGETSGFATAHN